MIPTADNFYDDKKSPLENMINFAKMHVNLSQQTVISEMRIYSIFGGLHAINQLEKDKNDVLKFYPLENIK